MAIDSSPAPVTDQHPTGAVIDKLAFVHDASVEHGIEIDRLIAEANKDRSQ